MKDLIMFLLGCLMCLATGFVIGHDMAQREEHQTAVKAGLGRYVFDPATGRARFEYLPRGGTP